MWSKFGNSSISMRKVTKPQFYKNLTRKTTLFKKWSWFKLNNLGLVLGIALKFYTSIAKRLAFWFLIPTFVEVKGDKLSGRLFCLPTPSKTSNLNKAKVNLAYYWCSGKWLVIIIFSEKWISNIMLVKQRWSSSKGVVK